MTSNIVVFKPPDEEEVTINKTEREILYDKFEKTAHIDAHHFKSFMEMVNNEEREQKTISTIPSILIKSVLPYSIPIIRAIPEFTVKPKTVDVFKNKKSGIKERNAQREKERLKDKSYSISVQLGHPIRGYLYNKRKAPEKAYTDADIITIPTNETFDIMGLVLPQQIIKTVDKSFLNYIDEVPMVDILMAGKFGLRNFQSGNYTQSRISSISPQVLKKYEIIHFKSDDDAKLKINAFAYYIDFTSEFYERNLVMMYKHIYNMPMSKYLKNQKELYNLFNPEFNTHHPSHKHTPIETQLSKLNNVALSDSVFANKFMFDKMKILDVHNQVDMLGISSPFSKKLLQDLDKTQSYEKTIAEFNALKFKKTLEYAKKKAISVNKFDTDNLDKLTVAQRKVVDLEFNKLEKFYSDIKTNSADFDLVNTLFWAMSNGKTLMIKDTLKELSKKVSMPKKIEEATALLQTKKKVSLVCPHVIAKATKLLAPAKNEMQKSGMVRDYLINSFSLPASRDGYYCRICGELMAEADEEEISKYAAGKRISFVVEYDKLKSVIWKEVAYIITVYVKFKDSVNHKNIISSMANALRPEIGYIETNLMKIKSNSKDSIKDLISIYTATYAFAMVVHMIDSNYGKITFAFRPGQGSRDSSNPRARGGKAMPKDRQKRLQNIINNALYLILRMKSVTINEVASISTETIKPILIKAYKWASSLKSDESTIKSQLDKDMPDLDTDNVYNYIKHTKMISDPKLKSPTVKQILGREWSDIKNGFVENKSVYETSFIPPSSTTLQKTDAEKYNHGSYLSMINYVKNKMYNKNAVPYSNELKLHDKQYAYLADSEEKLYQEYRRSILRPFTNVELHDNFMLKYNDFSPKNIKIDKYYDNSGHPHKFDIFLYQKTNAKGMLSGPKKEYTKKDITGWIKNHDEKKLHDFKKWFIVDERCSTCKILLSKTKNTSIKQALQKIDDVKIFYKYYENRCPKGELHDYIIALQSKKENSCKKCGITTKIVESQDKKYYSKYIKIFEKYQADKLKFEKRDMIDLTQKHKSTSVKLKFAEWKINNAPILELTRTFKVKYNIWINLGLSINQNYTAIETEKLNPSLTATPSTLHLRNIQLYNYYLHVVATYYLIKNYDISPDLPYDLKHIMAKNKVSNLRRKLSELPSGIVEKYSYYKNTLAPHLVSNFLLHTISSTILNINTAMSKAGSNVAKEATMYIIKSIIDSEKLLGKPDLTKFATSVVTSTEPGEGLDVDPGESDDGIDAQDDYNVPIEEEKSLAELGDSDPDDEFALGNMDIERDEDENMNNNAMGF